MINPRILGTLPIRSLAVFAAVAIGLLVAQAPRLSAADASAPALPLKATCAKAAGETGPYVLTLVNTSAGDLNVSASVQLSLPSHSAKKTRDVGPAPVKAGQAWTLDGLAAGDKVTVSAKGYAPLEIKVP